MTTQPQDAVLGIGASPRRGGNTDILLEAVLAGARDEGHATTTVHLRDILYKPCIGCERCRRDKACTGLTDGMTTLYPLIDASRGLVLISPAHNYNVTAWMKAFIDRLYCYYDFTDPRPGPWSSRLAGQGRRAAVVTVCEQQDIRDMGYTMDAMCAPLTALGFEIAGILPVLNSFARGAVKQQPEILDQARELGRTLIKGR